MALEILVNALKCAGYLCAMADIVKASGRTNHGRESTGTERQRHADIQNFAIL